MRISTNMTGNNALYNIQLAHNQLNKLNERLASQNNINRPSDDPVNARLLIGLNEKMDAGEQYRSNITKADIWNKVTHTALDGMYKFVGQAKSLVASITSGTADGNIVSSAINQLTLIKQQIVDMGNTQLDGIYIFGGGEIGTPPFDANTSAYSGDGTKLTIDIGLGSSEIKNILGSDILTGAGSPYGSTNILQTLDDLIAALNTDPADSAAIQTAAKDLYQGGLQLESAITAVASKATRLNNANTMNTNTQNTLLTIYEGVQNADLAELGVKLLQQETAFNATLSATARINQMSLLDYMR